MNAAVNAAVNVAVNAGQSAEQATRPAVNAEVNAEAKARESAEQAAQLSVNAAVKAGGSVEQAAQGDPLWGRVGRRVAAEMVSSAEGIGPAAAMRARVMTGGPVSAPPRTPAALERMHSLLQSNV